MSREYVLMESFIAGQDFTDGNPEGSTDRLGDLYKPVKLNAAGHLIKCTAITDLAIGVLHYTGKVGDHCQVAIGGASPVQLKVGAAANAGTAFSPGANSDDNRAILRAGGGKAFCRTLEPITTADDEGAVRCLILPVAV